MESTVAKEAWRTLEVRVTPFPRSPFDFEKICEAADGRWAGTGDEEPGLSSSCGVVSFQWHDFFIHPDARAEQVARLFVEADIEASDIEAHVVWTVMERTIE